LLLSFKDRSRLTIGLLSVYAAAMWVTTIILNQHYIIDLLAGAVIAVIAWWFARNGWPYLKGRAGRDEGDQVLLKSTAGN
jgi:membrane-associated phospholipid phosphatase